MPEERNKEKHKITDTEINFLIKLQHMMNTQDTVCQADPRFWVVVQETKEYVGEEYGSECDLVCDGDTIIEKCDINSLMLYLADYHYDHKEELDEKGIYFIEPTDNFKHWQINKMFNKEYGPNKEYDDNLVVYDVDDIMEYMKDEGIFSNDYDLVCYNINNTSIVPNTMFLTFEEAKKHIELNHYHYKNARPYAMTAWRSPQVEQLYNILQKVNWESLR